MWIAGYRNLCIGSGKLLLYMHMRRQDAVIYMYEASSYVCTMSGREWMIFQFSNVKVHSFVVFVS